MIKKLSFVLTVILSVICISSCSGAADEEILSSLEQIAPKAAELYDVIYGDVLPHGDADEIGMCVVSPESKYTEIKQIKDALSEVFSEEYAQILSNTAFKGVSADEGEISPKFFEQNGTLYVNPTVTEKFSVIGCIDLTGSKVVKKNKFMAIVEVPRADGEDDDMEITLRFTEDGWKIDNINF